MAEDAVRRVAMPRLRAAWLREMGVEILWPVAARPLPRPALQAGEGRSTLAEAGDGSSPDSASSDGMALLQPHPASGDPMPEEGRPPAIVEAASQAIEGNEALPHDNPLTLQCRLYAGEARPEGARWVVVADAVELHASREGPARFLDAMIRAVLPGAQVSTASIPVADEMAVGWLGADDVFVRLALPGVRLVLIGTAARRAAGMPTRLGELGWFQAGATRLPAVALPLPNDLTASPTGKADAWRVLRALDSAGS